jgi:3'-phosphoadenosine 5'-phosphosulfate (PAPS) 3'-phosphatase
VLDLLFFFAHGEFDDSVLLGGSFVADIKKQIQAIIKTAETAVNSKRDDLFVDSSTYNAAKAILEEVKAQSPDDKVLAALKMEGPVQFMQVLSMMQIVLASLADEPKQPRQPTQVGGSSGGPNDWMR